MKQAKARRRSAREHCPSALTTGMFLTIGQAARMLGVSERSIYSYLHNGKLAGERVENTTMVNAASVALFTPRAQGRIRGSVPRWRKAPKPNAQWLTIITVRQRPAQEERLEQVLDEIHQKNAHCFPGTAARYLVRDQHDPDEMTLVLVWRTAVMPPDEEREAALAALRTDLAESLDWETASVKEGLSLLHA